jgi:hypothetical protein
MEEKRNSYRVLVRKLEAKGRKRLLGRPRRRWEGSLKWILNKCDGVVLMYVAEGTYKRWAVVNAVMNLWVSQNGGVGGIFD